MGVSEGLGGMLWNEHESEPDICMFHQLKNDLPSLSHVACEWSMDLTGFQMLLW